VHHFKRHPRKSRPHKRHPSKCCPRKHHPRKPHSLKPHPRKRYSRKPHPRKRHPREGGDPGKVNTSRRSKLRKFPAYFCVKNFLPISYKK
jgi:hypothetical protein